MCLGGGVMDVTQKSQRAILRVDILCHYDMFLPKLNMLGTTLYQANAGSRIVY